MLETCENVMWISYESSLYFLILLGSVHSFTMKLNHCLTSVWHFSHSKMLSWPAFVGRNRSTSSASEIIATQFHNCNVSSKHTISSTRKVNHQPPLKRTDSARMNQKNTGTADRATIPTDTHISSRAFFFASESKNKIVWCQHYKKKE